MLVYLALVLSFHRSLTESALLRFNRPSRTCRADFSLFRSAAFRAGSPLISARRKSCRLVTRSSDNVRRKPGVPTYPHLDRFPVSRDLYRQQKGSDRDARFAIVSRVARHARTLYGLESPKESGSPLPYQICSNNFSRRDMARYDSAAAILRRR